MGSLLYTKFFRILGSGCLLFLSIIDVIVRKLMVGLGRHAVPDPWHFLHSSVKGSRTPFVLRRIDRIPKYNLTFDMALTATSTGVEWSAQEKARAESLCTDHPLPDFIRFPCASTRPAKIEVKAQGNRYGKFGPSLIMFVMMVICTQTGGGDLLEFPHPFPLSASIRANLPPLGIRLDVRCTSIGFVGSAPKDMKSGTRLAPDQITRYLLQVLLDNMHSLM